MHEMGECCDVGGGGDEVLGPLGELCLGGLNVCVHDF